MDKCDISYLIDQLDKSQKRYMDAEIFISKLPNLPWWRRLFIHKDVINFLQQQLRNYDSNHLATGDSDGELIQSLLQK